MGRSLSSDNPTIVSAFHSALARQLLVLVLVAIALAVVFNAVRTVQYRRLKAAGGGGGGGAGAGPGAQRARVSRPATPEALGRKILRIGFGCLWLLDGLLQLQPQMPLGMPGGVLQPAAAGSPQWVVDLVNRGATIWTNHPVQAAAATVWIQVGLGIWLLVAPRGLWSRAGGAASAAWGLVVWAFGEAFGGIFAPGLSWLFGAPGAVLFYVAAGVLLALPERSFATPRLGRVVLRSMGVFFVAMAVLQAWPGRGFWQGHATAGASASQAGSLTTMVRQMAQTSQPRFLTSWLSAFASFDSAHGWGVNLVVVLALAAIGVALCLGRPRLALVAVAAAAVLCLADWVLVEDLGFLGGTGTDPNSMVPILVVLAGGYAAMARVPAAVTETAPTLAAVTETAPALAAVTATVTAPAVAGAEAPAPGAAPAPPGGTPPGGTVPPPGGGAGGPSGQGWWERLTPGYLLRVVGALGALAIVMVGAAPMALAATNPHTDPILTEALDGTPNSVDTPAPGFTLLSQHGTPVRLAGLEGKAVALTFIDPVCTSDCPLIAQEFRLADQQLGAQASRVEFVAVVANPIYRSISVTNAFDRQEGLTHLANWLYLTGTVAQLQRVWDDYGIQVGIEPAGAMIAHSELAVVIDPRGQERAIMSDDPGPGGPATASFATLLSQQLTGVLRS